MKKIKILEFESKEEMRIRNEQLAKQIGCNGNITKYLFSMREEFQGYNNFVVIIDKYINLLTLEEKDRIKEIGIAEEECGEEGKET